MSQRRAGGEMGVLLFGRGASPPRAALGRECVLLPGRVGVTVAVHNPCLCDSRPWCASQLAIFDLFEVVVCNSIYIKPCSENKTAGRDCLASGIRSHPWRFLGSPIKKLPHNQKADGDSRSAGTEKGRMPRRTLC